MIMAQSQLGGIPVQNRLSTILLLTALGDWLSFFAIIVWSERLEGGPYWAAGTVLLKSLGAFLGAVLLPRYSGKYSWNQILAFSQLASGLAALILFLICIALEDPNPLFLFSIFFLQSLFSQAFGISRDAYSKEAGAEKDESYSHHTIAQAILEKGVSFSQFLGPLLFLFGYLTLSNAVVPFCFLIDAISFFVSAFLIVGKIPQIKSELPALRFKATWSAISKNHKLRLIFLIRAVLLIAPICLANYALFGLTREVYNYPMAFVTVIYSVIGLGKFVSNLFSSMSFNLEMENTTQIKRTSQILTLASLAYGISVAGISSGVEILAVFGCFIFGFSNGLQITLSRAVTRFLVGRKINVGEVYSLEAAIAQVISIPVFVFYTGFTIQPQFAGVLAVIMMAVFVAPAFWFLGRESVV